jgi:hypothetical protein
MNKMYSDASSREDALKAARKFCKRFNMWFDVEPYGFSCIDIRKQEKDYADNADYTIWFPEEECLSH